MTTRRMNKLPVTRRRRVRTTTTRRRMNKQPDAQGPKKRQKDQKWQAAIMTTKYLLFYQS